jgi:hypothetical protein
MEKTIKRSGPNVDLEVLSFVATTPQMIRRAASIPNAAPALLRTEEAAHAWLTGPLSQALCHRQNGRLRIVQAGFDKEDLDAGGSKKGD